MTEQLVGTRSENYCVDLKVFSGPLDLLLYLIQKEEVDIYDIPIARITRQYLRYVEMMKTLNLDVAGEFILMAAILIRIKTKLLLPRDEADTGELDAREELIMALVEYRKYKEAGEILREKALQEELNYIPPSPVERVETRIDLSPATSLYDLLVALREVLTRSREERIHEVNAQEVSIEDRIRYVMAVLREKEFATFSDLFADMPRKIVAVVTFIAVLELARTRRIRIFQSRPYAEIRVYRGEKFDSFRLKIDLVEFSSEEERTVHHETEPVH